MTTQTLVGQEIASKVAVIARGKPGATATPITLAGGTALGAPTSGAHVKGELVLDDAGVVWYCTVAGTPGTWVRSSTLPQIISTLIHGGSSVLTTGAKKAYLSIPYDCTFLKWRLLADVAGAVVVDIWKDTYANFPPTVADTITASAKPTISATNIKAESTSVSTWSGGTAQASAGDILEFNVDSVSTITILKVELTILAR